MTLRWIAVLSLLLTACTSSDKPAYSSCAVPHDLHVVLLGGIGSHATLTTIPSVNQNSAELTIRLWSELPHTSETVFSLVGRGVCEGEIMRMTFGAGENQFMKVLGGEAVGVFNEALNEGPMGRWKLQVQEKQAGKMPTRITGTWSQALTSAEIQASNQPQSNVEQSQDKGAKQANVWPTDVEVTPEDTASRLVRLERMRQRVLDYHRQQQANPADVGE